MSPHTQVWKSVHITCHTCTMAKALRRERPTNNQQPTDQRGLFAVSPHSPANRHLFRRNTSSQITSSPFRRAASESYRMSTLSCRTFVWGGNGVLTRDDDGQDACICNNEQWSDRNILGLASCVPPKVHVIFGWIGSVISAAALCHAAYHLRRQVIVNSTCLSLHNLVFLPP